VCVSPGWERTCILAFQFDFCRWPPLTFFDIFDGALSSASSLPIASRISLSVADACSEPVRSKYSRVHLQHAHNAHAIHTPR
jgi:hypothetical protein